MPCLARLLRHFVASNVTMAQRYSQDARRSSKLLIRWRSPLPYGQAVIPNAQRPAPHRRIHWMAKHATRATGPAARNDKTRFHRGADQAVPLRRRRLRDPVAQGLDPVQLAGEPLRPGPPGGRGPGPGRSGGDRDPRLRRDQHRHPGQTHLRAHPPRRGQRHRLHGRGPVQPVPAGHGHGAAFPRRRGPGRHRRLPRQRLSRHAPGAAGGPARGPGSRASPCSPARRRGASRPSCEPPTPASWSRSTTT